MNIQTRIEDIGEQLRAEIRSRFQASTFLAGFSFTLLGVQITGLWQPVEIPRLLPVCVCGSDAHGHFPLNFRDHEAR
jgi:hypothetical protein